MNVGFPIGAIMNNVMLRHHDSHTGKANQLMNSKLAMFVIQIIPVIH